MMELEQVLERLKSHEKVLAIILFGSTVRGETTPLSDVDIAVVVEDPTPEDEAELGSLYSRRIDLVLFHRLPPYIQFHVLREGKVLYLRDEERFKEIKFRTIRNYLEHSRMYRKMREMLLEVE
ncbi:MAG: nucleotidyltransferase domain-containing protein [Candidatus Korarchaeota archaeon]|nr:nucleotidyltransferase domain-containing protein [Candidatus Korarchaeota archaeon]